MVRMQSQTLLGSFLLCFCPTLCLFILSFGFHNKNSQPILSEKGHLFSNCLLKVYHIQRAPITLSPLFFIFHSRCLAQYLAHLMLIEKVNNCVGGEKMNEDKEMNQYRNTDL